MSAGCREERVAEEVVPGSDPRRPMVSPQRSICVPEDRHRPEQDVLHRVAAALVSGVGNPADPAKVTTLAGAREMIGTVVLGKSVRPDDPEIRAGHDLAELSSTTYWGSTGTRHAR
jgi:hypothetical protein